MCELVEDKLKELENLLELKHVEINNLKLEMAKVAQETISIEGGIKVLKELLDEKFEKEKTKEATPETVAEVKPKHK